MHRATGTAVQTPVRSQPQQAAEALGTRLEHERDEAERVAWTALARYKFVLFGY